MKFLSLFLVLFSMAAFAQEKQARSNDVASKYVRESNGNFFRYVNGTKCQITNEVSSFKVSQHPNDAAMVYYVRGGDLYYLRNADKSYPCPKANKAVLVENIKEYSVTPSTKTDVVNFTLDYNGNFKGWPNSGSPLISASGVSDYSHNGCFGASGKSFSSYVVFALSRNGQVLKVKGKEEGNAKWTSEKYSDLKSFKSQSNVCN